MLKIDPRIERALVTGASSGLGKAVSVALASYGIEVYGTSRDIKRIPEGVKALKLDLSSASFTHHFITEHREIVSNVDLLINNAGYGVYAPFELFPRDEMDVHLHVMLKGPLHLCREVYPCMLKRKFGIIVNVSSLASDWPMPYCSMYNTVKAGLSGFSRSLMLESSNTGVSILDFQPGDFSTGFNKTMSLRHPIPNDPSLQHTWTKLERHLENAPSAEKVADRMLKLLKRPRSGRYTAGSYYQRVFAPLGVRLLGLKQRLGLIRCYDSVQSRSIIE